MIKYQNMFHPIYFFFFKLDTIITRTLSNNLEVIGFGGALFSFLTVTGMWFCGGDRWLDLQA